MNSTRSKGLRANMEVAPKSKSSTARMRREGEPIAISTKRTAAARALAELGAARRVIKKHRRAKEADASTKPQAPPLPFQAKHHILDQPGSMFADRGDLIFDTRTGWYGFLKTSDDKGNLIFVSNDGREHAAQRADCEWTPISMIRLMEFNARGWKLAAEWPAPGAPKPATERCRADVHIGQWVHDCKNEEQGVVAVDPLGDLIIYQMEDGRFGACRASEAMIDPDRFEKVPSVELISPRTRFGGDPFYQLACLVTLLSDRIDAELHTFDEAAVSDVRAKVRECLGDANKALSDLSNETRTDWLTGQLKPSETKSVPAPA